MVINSGSIADPFEFTADRQLLGGSKRSANGTYLIDYWDSAGTPIFKRTFSLKWRSITSAQRTAILNKVNECTIASCSATFPDSSTATIYYDPSNGINETTVRSGSGYLYNMEVKFVEA